MNFSKTPGHGRCRWNSDFFRGRGLSGVQLVISEDHQELGKARRAVLGGVPWQRCQFHLQENAQGYVPRKTLQSEVAADVRAIFNAANRQEAGTLLTRMVAKYEKTASALAAWMETNWPEGLTVFYFPRQHRRRLRSANGMERLNRQVRCRSRVVVLFPNVASCERLVTAVLKEIFEELETSRIYLRLEDDGTTE